MPASALILLVRKAIPGVGITPTRIAFTPMEQIPETSAFSSMYPEMRVSLPMRILGTCPFFLKRCAVARPMFMAISDVMGYSFATPLIPSVPNNLPIAFLSSIMSVMNRSRSVEEIFP
jgi:hypothetical protein